MCDTVHQIRKRTQYEAEPVEIPEKTTKWPSNLWMSELELCIFFFSNGSFLWSGIKKMFHPAQCHHQGMCVSVRLGRKKAWAALNKQALCRLCDSAEPTKWEQISQDSSESIRGFTQFFLLATISCSHLMSPGFERFWHFRFNRNWHANKHAHTQIQTCSACVNSFSSQWLIKIMSTAHVCSSYLLCGPCGSVWTWFCTNPLACPPSAEGKYQVSII